jgi:glycogen debranching enzyme
VDIKADLDALCTSGADEAFKNLDLVDLNVLLHRCDEEERDATGESICGDLACSSRG